MGGIGSGRHGGASVTADYRQLDVRKMHRAGVLRPGYAGSWCWYWGEEARATIIFEARADEIQLRYTATQQGARKDYDYTVPLSWTPCTYGGLRPWFRCPRCGRRVAILYGGAFFACRHCYQLAYQVQREVAHDRMARRADAIRKRLGWDAGILNPTSMKPKGMRWRTYWRLRDQYDELSHSSLAGLMARFGIR